jgi:hypothetical protein
MGTPAMNLNQNQVLGIVATVLAVLVGSTAQLTDLFGPEVTKTIVSASSLLSAVLTGVLTLTSGQKSVAQNLVSDGAKLVVNAGASKAMAQLAMDPAVDNIMPAKGDEAAVQAIAKG